MPPRTPSPGDATAPQAAPEAPAEVPGPRDYVTTLVTGPGRVPRPAVTGRRVWLTGDGPAGYRPGRAGWAEPLAAAGDPRAAAELIVKLLRPAPEATHG